MDQFEDITLMQEIQNGNRNAFAVLVNRHSKYFFAIAYRFTTNRDLAEDILQTAFLKLWESPHKFDCNGSAGFKTWFARCVVNLCLDDRRARRPIVNIDDFEVSDTKTPMADVIEERNRRKILVEAINKLSGPYRTAINLGVIQEIKYGEVAKIMKKSESAVKVLINRAKHQLKDIIKEQGYGI